MRGRGDTPGAGAVIPRVIHRIWLGSEPMPEEYERYGESWREHHPGWEMRLWTDSNLPELAYRDAFERARNHGERSDVLRYELLVRIGGVYVDTDVECLRSIEPLLDGVSAFAGRVRGDKLGSAVLGSVPGHPAFERVLREGAERIGSGHQSGTLGPRFLSDVLKDAPDVTLFDPEVFYPFHHRRSPDKDGEDAGSYAIHHVDASWKSREDLRNDIRRVRNRLEKTTARNEKLRQKTRRLAKRAKRARARERKLARRVERARTRLAHVERSLWWRVRRPLARLYRLAAARSARGSGSGVSVRSRRERSGS